jgi:membrane protein implicated in regulation of membrane protease activity
MGPGSPEVWRVVWFVAAVVGLRVLGTPNLRLWSLPFVLGASGAAAAAVASVPVLLEWVVFLGLSGVTLALETWLLAPRLGSLPPLARIGSARWVGREAVVRRGVSARRPASVRIRWDHFLAESESGEDMPKGTTVMVTGIRGWRLVVEPVEGKEAGRDRERAVS